MAIIKGELRDSNQSIEDNVLFSIKIATSNNFLTWSGHFAVQKTNKIKVGNSYTIKLEDDRNGEIIIQSFGVNNKGNNEFSFIGAGPLK